MCLKQHSNIHAVWEAVKINGVITNIQHFSINDGPGIRTTVFFKGCNLHCYWCHNPEAIERKIRIQFNRSKCISCGECVLACPNVVQGRTALFTDSCIGCGRCAGACFAQALTPDGREISFDSLISEIKKDTDIYRESNGGVTFSGGEPLLQHEFLISILNECKRLCIHTAIETAACVPNEILAKVLPLVDFVYCDIKSVDEKKHIEATGKSNKLILSNIRYMCENHTNVHLRTPVVPGFNDTPSSIRDIAEFVVSLPRRPSLELLPFHGYCKGKYQALGLKFAAENLSEPLYLNKLKEVLTNYGID